MDAYGRRAREIAREIDGLDTDGLLGTLPVETLNLRVVGSIPTRLTRISIKFADFSRQAGRVSG